MINLFQLIRNVGMFDSFTGTAATRLSRFTVMYGENGRGKTTLAAILRSLSAGDAAPIVGRRRLGAAHDPHVVVDCDGGAHVFQGTWDSALPELTIFDDVFTNANVHSGIVVESDHRQNLHELIIGAQGIALNQALQQSVLRIDEHNARLRELATAIPQNVRGPFSVDEFCSLATRWDIVESIQEAERTRAAISEATAVQRMPPLETARIPRIDPDATAAILARNLPALGAAALAEVQRHFATLGNGGEAWVGDGVSRLVPAGTERDVLCPFCSQNVNGLSLVEHYREYFSNAYSELKRDIASELNTIVAVHSDDAIATALRVFATNIDRLVFWARFCELPALAVDVDGLPKRWRAARESVVGALSEKRTSPPEARALSEETRRLINSFNAASGTVDTYNALVEEANRQIALAKERSLSGSGEAVEFDLRRLRAIEVRFTAVVEVGCNAYLAEKTAKSATETQRDLARAELDNYRQAVFPAYETAINLFLRRFNAGFRLGSVTSANVRGGSTCTYSVVINNTDVPVGRENAGMIGPSFRNTLSSGDRSTLALAFFFASLDRDAAIPQRIVLLDDPITSLDDHRQLATAQEIRKLAAQVAQVIVFSHDRPFLCQVWERADRDARAALEVVRAANGSMIRAWDVNRDIVTEHDRRHERLTEYVATGAGDSRAVAESIRPMLETFIRVSYPEEFPPGSTLGPFQGLSAQRVGGPRELLNGNDTTELGELLEYANRFHHDTNPALAMEQINDAELLLFAQRALRFARRA